MNNIIQRKCIWHYILAFLCIRQEDNKFSAMYSIHKLNKMQSPYLFSMIHNVFYEIEYQTRLAQVQCFLMHLETEIIIIIILRLTAVECQLIKGMEITHCDSSSRISWIYFLYEESMYRINSKVNEQDWKKLLISIEMNKYRMLNWSAWLFYKKNGSD